MQMGMLTGALTLCLATVSAHSQQPPQTWHLVDHPNHTGAGTARLLTTSSIDTYSSIAGPPKHAVLEIKCSTPLTSSVTISIDSDPTFAVKTDGTVTLAIRLDGEPTTHAAWANLTLHQILIYDLRDLLPSHQRLAIDLPIGTQLQPLTFDLSQLSSAMRDANCRTRL